MKFDAIIIGGGPSGSVAATLLARNLWSIALIEKTVFPRRKVCGEFISATTMPLIGELSIMDEFRRMAGPAVRRVGLFSGRSVTEAPMPRSTARNAEWGRAIGREHLDTLLLAAATRAGATVMQPWKAIGLTRTGEGFRVTVSQKGTLREIDATFVIGCNGAWEPSPFPWNPSRRHEPCDLLAFKAHFVGGDLPNDLMPLLAFPGGYGGMVRTDSGRTSLSCCVRRDALGDIRRAHDGSSAARAVLLHVAETTAGVGDAIRTASLQGGGLSAGPIRPGIRRRYDHGIFLAGNAAGEAHPIIAEGISMAMQSSWLLARVLGKRPEAGLGRPQLENFGRRYAKGWYRSFAPRIYAANLFAEAAIRVPVSGVAEALVSRFPKLLTAGAKLSGKSTNISNILHCLG